VGIATGLSGSIVLAGEPDPARVQGMKTAAESMKAQSEADSKEADVAKTAADKSTGDLKAAFESLATALQARATALTQVSTAMSGSDADAIKKARADASAKDDAVRRARALVEVRQNQARINAMLTDEHQAAVMKAVADVNKPLATDLIAAEKATVDPLIKLADALAKPDTTWDDIETTRDTWIQASNAVQLAQSTLDFANNAVELRAAAHKDDPAIATKLEDLIKKDKQMLTAMKIKNDQALVMRQIDREQQTMLRDLNAALAAKAPAAPARGEPRK
jgi:hypothetical protein